MRSLLERFDRVDTSLNRWLVAHSITILRISLGLVFLFFGALKFVPDLSPIQGLVERTTTALTFGLIPAGVGLVVVAVLEVAIGLSFIRASANREFLTACGKADPPNDSESTPFG